MGIIPIDSSTAVIGSNNERDRNFSKSTSTRRPRCDSTSSSCSDSSSSSMNSWTSSRPTRRNNKNRKQYHQQHSHSYNHSGSNSRSMRSRGGEKKSSPPRKKSNNNNNKNQTRTVEEEEKCRDRYVAMDCEMVGIGLKGHQSMLARVTIIDWDCKTLLDTFVKPTSEITDYRTFVSGIVPENLVETKESTASSSSSCDSSSTTSILNVSLIDIETCRQKVMKILQGKVLVGHALKNDLHALNITHPWYETRDTAKYEPFMKVRFDDGVLWPRKLKDLVNEKLNNHENFQIPGKPHSAYEDAKAALDVYRCAQHKWEKAMEYKIKKTKQIMQQQQQKNKQ